MPGVYHSLFIAVVKQLVTKTMRLQLCAVLDGARVSSCDRQPSNEMCTSDLPKVTGFISCGQYSWLLSAYFDGCSTLYFNLWHGSLKCE